MSLEGRSSLLLNVHALHFGILSRRNLAGSWSLGFGSLPCRSHLIMTNLKVLATTLCLENEREVPCVRVCHGFKR